MKNKSINRFLPSSHIARIALGVAIILLIPLVFTLLGRGVDGQGWHWTAGDFLVMGTLLFVAGLLFDFAMMKARSKKRRMILGGGVIFLFLWLWAELAVGVFTNWGS